MDARDHHQGEARAQPKRDYWVLVWQVLAVVVAVVGPVVGALVWADAKFTAQQKEQADQLTAIRKDQSDQLTAIRNDLGVVRAEVSSVKSAVDKLEGRFLALEARYNNRFGTDTSKEDEDILSDLREFRRLEQEPSVGKPGWSPEFVKLRSRTCSLRCPLAGSDADGCFRRCAERMNNCASDCPSTNPANNCIQKCATQSAEAIPSASASTAPIGP